MSNCIGPLLHDGAPCSGMDLEKFKLMQEIVCPEWNKNIKEFPETVQYRPFLPYGVGSHSSRSRRTISSFMLSPRTDQGCELEIRHLITEGSLQCTIGSNVIQLCNIVRIGKNLLHTPSNAGSISLKNYGLVCYVPYGIFRSEFSLEDRNTSVMFSSTAQLDGFQEVPPWKEIKAIVQKVQRRMSGDSNYSDVFVLLERNNFWNSQVEKYLALRAFLLAPF